MEEEGLTYKKKNNNISMILSFVFISICLFISGYNVKGYLDSDKITKEEHDKLLEIEKKKIIDSRESNSYTERVVFSTYGEDNILYLVDDDGNLYYKNNAEHIAGLNLCPTAVDYCNANSKYTNEMTKITGIEKVKKIRYVLDIAASDERFKLFAITENGDVYTVDNVNVKKVIEGQKITDLNNFSVTNHYYSFTTEDKNVKIDYSWMNDHYDIKTVTSK